MRWETKAKSRAWCSTPRLRSAFALLALVLGTLAATIFRPPPTNGPFARDFEAYYAAGATWNRGGDPYSRDIWSVEHTIAGVDASRDELLPFVGPAASLPLWSLLARLPFDAARSVWLIALACAWGALLLTALRLARVPADATLTIAGAALLTGCSGPIVSDIALGQAALVAACALGVALYAIDRRWTIATIAAACVAAIQPNLAVALAAQLTSRRAIASLAAAAAAFLGLTLALGGGFDGLHAYAQRLAAHGDGERFILIQYSIPAILAAFSIPLAAARSTGNVLTGIVIASIAYAAVRVRTQSLIVAAIGIALLPFALPFFHEHDFAIELIPALILGASADARVRTIAGAGAMCVLVDWLGVAQRPHTALLTASLAAAVAFGWAAYIRPTRPLAFAVPLATCALVAALAIPLALAHPAPVWPDMLGAFHAPPGADASAVWAAEQQRAGLSTLDPAWGILRGIPLFGCALLALAAYVLGVNPTTTRPPRTTSGTGVSDSPSHGPSVQ